MVIMVIVAVLCVAVAVIVTMNLVLNVATASQPYRQRVSNATEI